jgi:hypothetical protein
MSAMSALVARTASTVVKVGRLQVLKVLGNVLRLGAHGPE